jgi:photosystem II stability/assembly factor-like uncharacterized protein
MRFARPTSMDFRRALVPGLAVLAFAITGCSSNTVEPPPPLPPLNSVEIVPSGDSLAVGGTRQFVGTAYDTTDTAVPGATFAWTTTHSGVVTVNGNGLATAQGEGSAYVIASAGGKSDSAMVFVRGLQAGWYGQTSNTSRILNGVHFLPDGRTGFAVGDQGTLVRTLDAGTTWTTRTSGASARLNSVWFSSPGKGWIAGDAGVVLKSTNGGDSWVRDLGVNASENLRCIRFVGDSHGWAVGSNGVVVRTVNGGASWTRTHPTAMQLNSVSFSDTSNGWAVGQSGTIIGTHDGGRSWYIVQPSVTGLTLQAVWRNSNTLAWGGGASGARVSTSATVDSLAWSSDTFGAQYDIRGLQMVDGTIGYAVGWNAGGAVLKTTNGGATWVPQLSNSTPGLNGMHFVDALRGWAVGDAGKIIHTSNGGND